MSGPSVAESDELLPPYEGIRLADVRIVRTPVEAAAALAREEGAGYLTVKTLAPMRPDEGYRRTRAFYDALGFVPLEIFPTLWGPEAPCLMMLKPLGR